MEIKTKISYSKDFEKQLAKVPEFIRKKVMLWVFLVESNGIWETAKLPGYHDESLKGERKGQRSVRMNRAYRLIYVVIAERVNIKLIEVHKHDY